MSYSVELKGDLIEIRFEGEQTAKAVAALKEDIINLSKDHPHNVLVNLSSIPGEKVPRGIESFFQNLPYRRYAIYGGVPKSVMRTKQLLDSLPEHPNLKFFHLEEDARAWLNS